MSLKTVDRIKAELLCKIEETMEQDGISQGEVARRIGAFRNNVNTVMRKTKVPTVDLLLKMTDAVGLRVDLKIRKLKD